MDPALRLAVSLARSPLTRAFKGRAEALTTEPLDWDVFFRTVERWGVEPVVLSNLRGIEGVPPAVLERSAAAERRSKVQSISKTLIVTGLAETLARGGIDAVVLKGPAAAVAAYDDPSLRSFGDADLLVRERDLGRARDIILAAGYSRSYDPVREERLLHDGHALEFTNHEIKVELHWMLLPRHLRFRMDMTNLWNRVKPAPCGPVEILLLSMPDMLVYLSAHGAKHEWERLRWICDVVQIAERMSDDELSAAVAIAHGAGGTRLLALAANLSRALFGESRLSLLPVSDQRDTRELVRHALFRLGIESEDSPADRRAERLDPALRQVVYWIRARERRSDRVASLARVLFVPGESDGGAGLAGWISRPFRLAARAVLRRREFAP